MSNPPRLEIVNERPRDSDKLINSLDPGAIEMVFGTPNSPRNNAVDVHLINNERRHDAQPHDNNDHLQPHHTVESELPSQPLLEPHMDKPRAPLAGPEIDDLDGDVHRVENHKPYPGIDDGLLEDGSTDKVHEDGEEHNGSTDKVGEPSMHDDGVGTEDGNWPWTSHDEPDFPYDGPNGLGNRFGDDSRPISPYPGSTPDVNTYQQKKNLAQGMMDLALLSANANQLRYVLESATAHPYYYPSLTLISLSIIFQIAVGVGLILNSRYDVNDKKEICKADKINNMTVLGVFMITIVNVFITSFSVATSTAPAPTLQQAG